MPDGPRLPPRAARRDPGLAPSGGGRGPRRTRRSDVAGPSVSGLRRALALVGAATAERPEAPPEELLLEVVSRLDGPAVEALIGRADGPVRKPVRLGQQAWAKALAQLPLGGPHPVPAAAIRPGQTQLSFDHAARKMRELAQTLVAGTDAHDLFGPDDFPVV
ncbi:MAG: hypothetical protein AAFZ18_30965, partial [Myxococcota bacterium]